MYLPDMAETYGCPIDIMPKQNTFVKSIPFQSLPLPHLKPYKQANGLSRRT